MKAGKGDVVRVHLNVPEIANSLKILTERMILHFDCFGPAKKLTTLVGMLAF